MKDAYYYAGGRRHDLERSSDRVAVDAGAARSAGVSDLDSVLTNASRLPGNLFLVAADALTPQLHEKLQAAGALRTVYRSGRAMVVPMPEIRIEFESDQRDDARRALDESGIAARIEDESPERMVVRPASGSSEDAMSLANFVHEHVQPASASVRMLQVIPRPGVRSK